MSASTSGSADGSPTPGFYPDPSIPGYIRYWNGAAWVPGTSRPAPAAGEEMPAAPANAAPPPALAPPAASSALRTSETARPETAHAETARPETRQPEAGRAEAARSEAGRAEAGRVDSGRADSGRADAGRADAGPAEEAARPAVGRPEETGPMFLDEEPEPEPLPRAAAADVRPRQSGPAPVREDPRRPHDGARGNGFGPEPDRWNSWAPDGPGAAERHEEAAGRAPGARTAPDDVVWPAPADRADAAAPVRNGESAGGAPAAGPAAQPPVRTAEPGPEPWAGPNGGYGPGADAPEARAAHAPAPQPVQPPPQGLVPAQGGGGSPAWSAPRPEGAHAGVYGPAAATGPAPSTGPAAATAPSAPPEGVIPWKPPVDNPFLQAAQAQGRPAGLGRRLGARLIDSAVLGAVVAAAAVPLWAKAADHIDGKLEGAKQSGETVTVWLLDGTTGACLGIVLAVLLLAGVVYEALPTAKWGRTLGKKLCGVRVLSIEGHDTPSFGAALRRWLVYGVLGLLVVGVVNVLWCLFDRPWRQCWHDKAAHTFVARAR
ncbi:RDD family protein [Streptomyces varsoviensis]|uniref:RDD family protein n=1 Tax=Streptomyces varsoviensis TaxID=67373 RepID=UPI0004CAF045|nr:RDD family protein [Streptomyces varsoviensis]